MARVDQWAGGFRIQAGDKWYSLHEIATEDSRKPIARLVGAALEQQQKKSGLYISSVVRKPEHYEEIPIATYIVAPREDILTYEAYQKFAKEVVYNSGILRLGGNERTQGYESVERLSKKRAEIYDARQVLHEITVEDTLVTVGASTAEEVSAPLGLHEETARRDVRKLYLQGQVRLAVYPTQQLARDVEAFYKGELPKDSKEYWKISDAALGYIAPEVFTE